MNFRRRYLSLLYLKYLLFVPFIFFYIILPLMVRYQLDISNNVLESALPRICSSLEDFLPLLSVWWIVFVLRESVEGDSSEVFYTYESINRTKFTDVAFLVVFYLLCMIPLYILLYLSFPGFEVSIALDFAKNIILCAFFSGLIYMIIYILRSTLFSLMFAFLFYVVFKATGLRFLQSISIYAGETITTTDILIPKYLIILGVSILLYLIGYIQNKRFIIK